MTKYVTIVGLFFCIFFVTSLCFGEPFLVSDPYPKSDEQPTDFRIVSQSLNVMVPAEKSPNGIVKLRYDLFNLPDGEHILEITAIDKARGKESVPTVMKIMKKGKDVTIVPLPSPPSEPLNTQRPPSRAIPGILK
jgi:hypothetical protein